MVSPSMASALSPEPWVIVRGSQGNVELGLADADQQAAHRRQAGRAVPAAHAHTLKRCNTLELRSSTHSLIAPCSRACHRASRHSYQDTGKKSTISNNSLA